MNQESSASKLKKHLKMVWLFQTNSNLFHVGSYIEFPYIVK